MTLRSLPPALLLALAAPAAADSGRDMGSWELAQLSFHERVIVRVKRMPAAPAKPAMSPPVEWKEKSGPKCVAVNDMAGALLSQRQTVDIVLTGGTRVRAKLDGDCRPLDFYSGFYLKPSADGKVCAGRDAIRVRSGDSCPISKFRSLKPVPAKR